NVPALGDVRTMEKLLGTLGAHVETKPGGITFVDTSAVDNVEAPYDLVKTMRASVVVLGPLTARHGRARVSLPGGCAIGAQPIEPTTIPDRIEAGTLLVAAAITRGNVLVRDCLPEHLEAVVAKLRAAGVEVTPEEGGLRVRAKADLKPTDISTQPFPGFPTD